MTYFNDFVIIYQKVMHKNLILVHYLAKNNEKEKGYEENKKVVDIDIGNHNAFEYEC